MFATQATHRLTRVVAGQPRIIGDQPLTVLSLTNDEVGTLEGPRASLVLSG